MFKKNSKMLLVSILMKLIIKIINFYQKLPGMFHYRCRFVPSCSSYAKCAIERFGIFKGCFLAFKRILRCNPWGGFGYDPVPNYKEERK